MKKIIRRITASMVAKRAGVSLGAASVVLNGGTKKIGVSEKTRTKILRAATALGYRTNAAARAMVKGRFNALSILFGKVEHTSLLPSARLMSILDAADAYGQSISLARASDAELSDEAYLSGLLSRVYADGLLINYNAEIPPEFERLLKRLRVPSVWLNVKRNLDAVYPDDRLAAKEVTRRFLARGFSDVAFVNDMGNTHYSFFDRKEGYEETMREAGFAPNVIIARNEGYGQIPDEQFLPIFASRKRPRAFICYAPEYARRLCEAAGKKGLHLGRDFHVATFDSESFSFDGIETPTAVMDECGLARTAVRMLLDEIDGQQMGLPSVSVPYSAYPGFDS